MSRQACAAQPPSDSSAAEAFSSQTCAAQPPSAPGGGLGFDLGLCGAAPEWFGWRPRIIGWNLYGAAPECVGWRPRLVLLADKRGELVPQITLLILRAGRLIKTLPVPLGTLVRERVRMKPAASSHCTMLQSGVDQA